MSFFECHYSRKIRKGTDDSASETAEKDWKCLKRLIIPGLFHIQKKLKNQSDISIVESQTTWKSAIPNRKDPPGGKTRHVID